MSAPVSGQLMLGGGVYQPPVKPRAGAIGKVERFIEQSPWRTAGQIAAAIDEPASRVSDVLNKLKHEGKAQQQERIGQHQRSVWAGTSEAGQAERDRVLAEIVAEHDGRMAEKAAERLPRAFLRAGAWSTEVQA